MQRSEGSVEVLIGYAAGERGAGIAYARLESSKLLRVGFRIEAPEACRERAAGYGALTAVSRALAKRSIRDVRFVLADEAFVEEIATGRGVVESLAIPYVRLRCTLNALTRFSVQAGGTDDLTQRARAEVALNVAA